MAEIIGIKENEVLIGLDDKEILSISPDKLNYTFPKVGDSVEVYGSGDNIVVSKTQSQTFSVPDYGPNTKRVSKIAYVLLAWLAGELGVHRFLRGQVGIGILYILTFGGCAIAALVDAIIALVKLSNYDGPDFYFDSEFGSWK
ncbi:TM2 domain-containing protein [Lactococcus laudensis]|uniref:TM2 domain-containing protein n=1 Tax=Pseudolactococcus laudensis TaxID=1494461 RepID=A0A7V8MZD7_9LACT|nr:TM2 domain-containing protein [Lactococcus laudensis]MBA0015759.1 TM2 domain-containing protein [Lactococcus laudensis]MBW9280746.1 TM2 domain-containing protein [Lactococcus laudensis]